MMTSSIFPFALLAASVPAAALAQSDPSQSGTDAQGNDIVVTATRSGDPIRADMIGGSVTVLDATDLEDRQTRQISDILRDVPGVAVSRLGAVGAQTQVRIRGTEGNHVLVLIDGIKVSDPYQGEYDFGTLLADDAARIEVLRGQQSALYGSDAIGGVIHYITLTGAEAPGVRLRAQGGSFGTFDGAARVAGVSGGLDYALSSSYLHTDGYPTARVGTRAIGSDNVGASLKTTWTPASNLRVTAVGRYSFTGAQFDNTDFDPTSPSLGLILDSPGVHSRNSAYYGLVRGELDLLDGRWTQAASAQVADTTRKAYQAGDAFDFGDKGRRLKGSYESTLRFGDDALRHRVTFAVDGEHETARNLSDAFGAFTGTNRTDNVGFVGEYDLTAADRLALGASVRYDDNSRFHDATTYRLQASYRFETGTRLRAAVGTGVKNPTLTELFGFFDGQFIGNAQLRPEKSKGWEAGVEQSLAGDKVLVGATWFDSRLHDEIFTDYSTGIAQPFNRDGLSKQRGVESFAQVRLGKAWRIDAAYTWLHAREEGTKETRRPSGIASVSLDWRAPEDRGGVNLTVRYNGKQTDVAYVLPPFGSPLGVKLDDYTLVNLAADWKLTGSLSLFGRIENLLGENYEEVYGYRTPGRAAYAGVRARF